MDISQALTNMIKLEIARKEFSTGSRGFHGTGKIIVDGVRYQAQAQAVLLGSKDDPHLKVDASTDEMAAALTALVADGLQARTFRTGRTGFRADGKVEARGQRFQASVQAVRLT
ncbi:hypothetical protein [Microtetraspora sp. NBRC 16547]|uniref:hypothetical protein n=1 Tax=Microtetraspora sp. NBRC 16547 TaxID=3030993 RepID=UPI0024A5363B|nr:hypothetical protein [Microtetraspora sp. NBRC 16547]GLW98247.1 hypothetical protein Misp02_23340 [Microtetraspora sp. NBRC 16547]